MTTNNDFHNRVTHSHAMNVSPIAINEFDEPSFIFTASDGTYWAIGP